MSEIRQRQEDADLDRFHKACDTVLQTILGETKSGYQITLGGAINQIFHHPQFTYSEGCGGVYRDKIKALCDYADSKYDDLFVKEI